VDHDDVEEVMRTMPIRRSLALTAAALALGAALAVADPTVRVIESPIGVRVLLTGDWANHWYTVWRGDAYAGGFDPLASQATLCTGECFAIDLEAVAGRTYWYRFDLLNPDGTLSRYGPFAVTIPDHPLGMRFVPNPGHGPTRVELSVPGGWRDAAVRVQARLYDLQGRLVRTLHEGALPRGVTGVAWDGRADDGTMLGAGIYLARLSSPLGSSVSRVLRVR
jgi:flagellar hook capping protein FlgD